MAAAGVTSMMVMVRMVFGHDGNPGFHELAADMDGDVASGSNGARMSIGQASKASEVSQRTIRLYEAIGATDLNHSGSALRIPTELRPVTKSGLSAPKPVFCV